MVKKYLKKPVVVEAIEFDNNVDEIQKFIDDRCKNEVKVRRDSLNEDAYVIVLPNLQCIGFEKGDFIVQGVDGSIYPVKKNTFWKVYQSLDEDNRIGW